MQVPALPEPGSIPVIQAETGPLFLSGQANGSCRPHIITKYLEKILLCNNYYIIFAMSSHTNTSTSLENK
jgi:hypothetical protein